MLISGDYYFKPPQKYSKTLSDFVSSPVILSCFEVLSNHGSIAGKFYAAPGGISLIP